MKRLFAIGLMLASAFALTNCAEELVGPDIFEDQLTKDETNASGNEGVPFKIYASIESAAETKTVTQKNGTSLKTVWVEGDKILGFYEKDGMLAETPIEFTVDPANLAAGEFTADVQDENLKTILNDEGSKYNWYFVYGYTGYTASAGLATINIPNVQSQNPSEEVAHIGGQSCPMHGQALNLSGPIFPRVTMKHLATLHEVTVRNNTQANTVSGATAGNIVLYNLGMSIATTGIWNTSNRISLAGNFELNLKDGTLKNYTDNVDNIILNLPSTGVTIAPGDTNNESKFYFVTAPIDNLQLGATYDSYYLTADPTSTISVDAYDALPVDEKNKYTGNILRKDELQFVINGSVRSTVTDKTLENFTGGKLKRFVIPVYELKKAPLESNAEDFVSPNSTQGIGWDENIGSFLRPNYVHRDDNTYLGGPMISFEENAKYPSSVYINGTLVEDVYVIGGQDVQGTILLQGFLKYMVDALPISFFASRYDDSPTAMTIKRINLLLPEYKDGYKTLTTRKSLSDCLGYVSSAMNLIGVTIDDSGISRETLIKFIDPNTITFANILTNGYLSKKDEQGNVHMLVMNEAGGVCKNLDVNTVNYFLGKFTWIDQDGNVYTATLDGLKAILGATRNNETGALIFASDQDKILAETTATAIYNKLYKTVSDKVGSSMSWAVDMVLDKVFTDPTDLMYKFIEAKLELEIMTYPYAPTYTATELNKGYQPIVFWGLHGTPLN